MKLCDGKPTYLMNILGSDCAVARCDNGGGRICFLWVGRGARGKRAEGSFQGQKQNCQKTKQKGGRPASDGGGNGGAVAWPVRCNSAVACCSVL